MHGCYPAASGETISLAQMALGFSHEGATFPTRFRFPEVVNSATSVSYLASTGEEAPRFPGLMFSDVLQCQGL